jgi:hypothetical protein
VSDLALRDDRLPWEPLTTPKETPKAFAAFAFYRDFGPRRSLAKTGQSLIDMGVRKGTLKGVVADLGDWSVKYRWVERVEAYDLYIDRITREANESEAMAAGRRQADLGVALQSAAVKRLRGYSSGDEQVAAIDPNEMDWHDIATISRVGVNTERLARGQPTDFLAAKMVISPADHYEVVEGLIHRVFLPILPAELHDRFWQSYEAMVKARS